MFCETLLFRRRNTSIELPTLPPWGYWDTIFGPRCSRIYLTFGRKRRDFGQKFIQHNKSSVKRYSFFVIVCDDTEVCAVCDTCHEALTRKRERKKWKRSRKAESRQIVNFCPPKAHHCHREQKRDVPCARAVYARGASASTARKDFSPHTF